uniref:Uncharacterized protein n=1 Tax=Anopheles culicifacies TaxID=139723 RepID=A0A182MPB9_9DIPT
MKFSEPPETPIHQKDGTPSQRDKSILPQTIDFVEPEADHRMRHQRFIRQQLHELEVKQSVMKRQLSELHGHRLADRLRSVEIEQRRLASASFNVSRQIAGLDKLHGSMLELLEDVEAIQGKFEKTVPDMRREIAKVEFGVAQAASEQGLVREEVHNAAKSIQAMAVSVSALQEERDTVKRLQGEVRQLKDELARIRSASVLHREMAHNRLEKVSCFNIGGTSGQCLVQRSFMVVSWLFGTHSHYMPETFFMKGN